MCFQITLPVSNGINFYVNKPFMHTHPYTIPPSHTHISVALAVYQLSSHGVKYHTVRSCFVLLVCVFLCVCVCARKRFHSYLCPSTSGRGYSRSLPWKRMSDPPCVCLRRAQRGNSQLRNRASRTPVNYSCTQVK